MVSTDDRSCASREQAEDIFCKARIIIGRGTFFALTEADCCIQKYVRMRSYAQQQGIAVSEGTRGFVFNADMTSIVQFLDIGTRASELR